MLTCMALTVYTYLIYLDIRKNKKPAHFIVHLWGTCPPIAHAREAAETAPNSDHLICAEEIFVSRLQSSSWTG